VLFNPTLINRDNDTLRTFQNENGHNQVYGT